MTENYQEALEMIDHSCHFTLSYFTLKIEDCSFTHVHINEK